MSKAAEKAYQAIRSRILSGAFAEDAHLKEEELAEICGVSRTPIRDALRKLAADNYVRIVPNHGTFVSRWTKGDIDDIFELRALLEGYAARRAAHHITADEIAELEACYQTIRELLTRADSFDHDAFLAANRQFHQTLRAAGRSDRLSVIVNRLVEQPIVMRTALSYRTEDLTRSNEHHREIIAAMRAGDGNWAEAIMRTHIYAAYQVYKRSYSGDTATRSAPEEAADQVAAIDSF